tara:strand:+ start:2413 stop:2673 length:261 start_codon:yes stop_codon:yes gene_type:complete
MSKEGIEALIDWINVDYESDERKRTIQKAIADLVLNYEMLEEKYDISWDLFRKIIAIVMFSEESLRFMKKNNTNRIFYNRGEEENE